MPSTNMLTPRSVLGFSAHTPAYEVYPARLMRFLRGMPSAVVDSQRAPVGNCTQLAG